MPQTFLVTEWRSLLFVASSSLAPSTATRISKINLVPSLFTHFSVVVSSIFFGNSARSLTNALAYSSSISPAFLPSHDRVTDAYAPLPNSYAPLSKITQAAPTTPPTASRTIPPNILATGRLPDFSGAGVRSGRSSRSLLFGIGGIAGRDRNSSLLPALCHSLKPCRHTSKFFQFELFRSVTLKSARLNGPATFLHYRHNTMRRSFEHTRLLTPLSYQHN